MEYSPPVLDWFQDCFDPITEDALCELEKDLQLQFPDDWRAFLLEFNAGFCREVLSFPAREPAELFSGGLLSQTMGIVNERGWDFDDIRSRLARLRGYGRIPDDLVPIAEAFGDPLCLSTTEGNFGKIFYWHQHRDPPNVHLIADSFTEFLGLLTPNPEFETYVEELPIFQAVERGNRPALKAFLADGGKVDCRNAQGQTLLMCALRSRWPKLAKLLVDHGAALEAIDRDDRTPIYHAAMHQSLDGVKLLLAAGASPRWCDERGMTLVKLTWEKAFYRVSEYLEKQIEN